MKQPLKERLTRTLNAMQATEVDSGIDVCHITTVRDAIEQVDSADKWKREALAWRVWWPLHVHGEVKHKAGIDSKLSDELADNAWQEVETARAANGGKDGRNGN